MALAILSCRAPWQPGGRSCADSARLDLPIDVSAFAGRGTLWPFGVHGGASPEGHPGIDFLLDGAGGSDGGSGGNGSGGIAVRASFSASILSITPETDFPGSSCIVMDSACVEVNLCHVRLDPSLKEGDEVARGQLLGTVGPAAADGSYSLHFGTYAGEDADPVCPADFLEPDTVRCLLGGAAGEGGRTGCGHFQDTVTWMGRSSYGETSSRALSVRCADGTSQAFDLPGEASLCNARLSAADRARMLACLGSACAGVW
jgi:hypothetical protein